LNKYFSLSLSICLSFSCAKAQNSPVQPSALGVSGFYNLFKNPLNGSGDAYRMGAAGVAVSYQKGFSSHLTFSTTLCGSMLDFANKENVNIGNGNKQLLLELDASLRYLFLTNEHVVKPYAQVGLGGSIYAGYWGAIIPIGLGFQINVTPSTFILINIQKRIAASTNQDDHYYFSIGLAGNIGKTKQTKKASNPAPPKDTDGDGIYDINDACPTVPGVVKYRGCPIPDRDGDGINDEEDKCPDVPGILKYQGCPIPDRDHDGINDEIDHCPDTPGVARFQGCPIPDRDHDGLNDEEDRCPNESGPISNQGCPVISNDVRSKISNAAENCLFETGKYKLLPKSFETLNVVAQILQADSSLFLKIRGYTDNVGNSKTNQILSENRAKSVISYLILKGISTHRLTAEGFGQLKPIDSNSTPLGRAKNRRVEIEVTSTR
jgi:OOP family OmpA-OmpF porin